LTDLVVAGARILDGTGAPPFEGFVGVDGDRIERVGRSGEVEPEAAARIELAGRALSPGFVDAHNHSDLAPLVEPGMDSALRQGVTTLVVGNCGSSAFPRAGAPELATLVGVAPDDLDLSWTSFGELVERLESSGPAINLATLVGHGALRMQVMGMQRRAPTGDELAAMRRLLEEGMEAGAVGLSSGLVYAPGTYADTEELVELASVLSARGGVYASHIRGEGERVFDAVGEAVEIGRRAGVPVHVSHLKLEGSFVQGRVGDLLGTIERARSDGVDVTADQYPYAAWASVLSSLLPPWATPADLPAILADPGSRARLVHTVERGEEGWQSSVHGVGWERIVIESHGGGSGVEGKSLAAVADELGESPADTCFRLLIADPDTAVIGHAMSEEDVGAILADEEVMVGSDASAMSPDGPLGAFPVHPRNYGTFPRVLGHYVRDEGRLALEAAIRKMTSLPADRFGLRGRGRIAAGAFADLVAFDPGRVRDVATYQDPHRFPRGIELVIVNGRVAWSPDGHGERAGRVLRRG
jgi:N-acyl-D-aspartate/D-glutamate deacylase